MISVLAEQVDQLESGSSPDLIRWACPVPYFGNAGTAQIATVGINPSNLEFTDQNGKQLEGDAQRLPTLRSLGLERWADADSRHLLEVAAGCDSYFRAEPYVRWFGVLERLLKPAGATYFGPAPSACHLDLVAFATSRKWGSLPTEARRWLIDQNSEGFALLLRTIPAGLLVLNGQAVVETFQAASGQTLERHRKLEWDLPRNEVDVPGFAYVGAITELAGVPLGRCVRVVGYNHNLQSSFGVTTAVAQRIGDWIQSQAPFET